MTSEHSALCRAPRTTSAALKTHLLRCTDHRPAAAGGHGPRRPARGTPAATASDGAPARIEDRLVDGLRSEAEDRLKQ